MGAMALVGWLFGELGVWAGKFGYDMSSALLAQWIAHRTSNPGVAGSSPAQGAIIYNN